MGCGSQRQFYAASSTVWSFKTLDSLPPEILFKIFDELDTITIYQSVYWVSKFFTRVVDNYNRHHLNLGSLSLQTFHPICSRIRPENITALTLTNEENAFGLLERFLEKFPLATFVRVRSIALTNIEDESLITQILLSIGESESNSELSSIKIKEPDESYDDVLSTIMTPILSKPSLKEFQSSLSDRRTSSSAIVFPDDCQIQRLIFENTCSVDFIRHIFSHTTSLKTLQVDDLDFDEETNLNENPTALNHNQSNDDDTFSNSDDSSENNEELPQNHEAHDEPDDIIQFDNAELMNQDNQNNERPSPQKERFTSIGSTDQLRSLTLIMCSMSMCKIEWLVQEMTALKHLRLATTVAYEDKRILDGVMWNHLTSDLETFQFVFTLTLDDYHQWDPDQCLKSYQTSYWLEEKRWFVALENCKDDISLYSLPYCKSTYVMKMRSNMYEYRTTAPFDCRNSLQNTKRISSLYLDASEFNGTYTNYDGPYFSNVSKFWLYQTWPRQKSMSRKIAEIVDLGTIEEFFRDEPLPTLEFAELLSHMKNLKSIKTTTDLLDSLNAAKFCCPWLLRSVSVHLSHYDRQRGVHVEPFCAMFPRIQYLSIPVDNVEACQYVLDELENHLIKANFQLLQMDDDDSTFENVDGETRDQFSTWLDELPQQYKHYRKEQQIHIWRR